MDGQLPTHYQDDRHSSHGDKPRIRLGGFPGVQGQANASVTPRMSAALLKPFRFQKPDENTPPNPFRFSSSMAPSTPVKSSFPVRLGGTSLSNLNHSMSNNCPPGNVYQGTRRQEAYNGNARVEVAALPQHDTPQTRFRRDISPSTNQAQTGGDQSPVTTGDSISEHGHPGPALEGNFDSLEYVARDMANIKQQNTSLKHQIEQFARNERQHLSDLERLQAKLSYATSQIAASERQSEEARSELAASTVRVEELSSKLAVAEESIVSMNEQVTRLTGDLENLRIQSEASKDKTRQVIAAIRERNEELFQGLQESKKAFNDLKAHHGECIQELCTLRTRASEAASTVQSISSSVWMTKAREARELNEELKADLDSSRRVADILKDQLHHCTGLLLESKDRVQELEMERAETIGKLEQRLQETKQSVDHALSLDKKYENLLDRLAARERDTVDAFGIAARTEEELKAAKDEITRLSLAITKKDEELVALRVSKEEQLPQLLAMQDVVNTRDKDIAALRVELKGLHESKADLKALLTEAKKSIIEKEQELLQARTVSPESDCRMQELVERFTKLQEEEVFERRRLHEALSASQTKCSDQKVEIQGLLARLKEGEIKCDQWRSEIAKLQNDLENERMNRAQVETRERETSEEYRRQLLAKDNSIAGLKAQLDEANESLSEKTKQLSTINATFVKLESDAEKERENAQRRVAGAAAVAQEKANLCITLEVSLAKLQEDVERLNKEKEAERARGERNVNAIQEMLTQAKSLAANLEKDVARLEGEKAEASQRADRAVATAQDKSTQVSVLQSSLDIVQRRLELVERERDAEKQKGKMVPVLQKDIQRLEKERDSAKQKADAAAATAAEKMSLLELAAKDVETQTTLQGVQEARAIAAERAFSLSQREVESEREKAMNWKSKFEQLESEVRLREEQSPRRPSGVEVEQLRLRIEALQLENSDLQQHAITLMKRYKQGDLTDAEKELVNYVVGLTESSNEQILIEKDNEIRSRGNQILVCQQRIKALQKHVAELLPQAGAQTGRLVNIQSLAVSGSSPLCAQSNKTANQEAALSSSTSHPKTPVEDAPSFTRLAQFSDDESHLSGLSPISEFPQETKKRDRPSSPAYGETRSQTTKKRIKGKEPAKTEALVSSVMAKKATDGSTSKGRQRKRRY